MMWMKIYQDKCDLKAISQREEVPFCWICCWFVAQFRQQPGGEHTNLTAAKFCFGLS